MQVLSLEDYIEFLTSMWFILYCVVLIFALFIIKGKGIKRPRKSRLEVAPKIEFKRTTTIDSEYGLGTFALDIFTLGGHGRLKEAKYEYETGYGVYVSKFNQSVDIRTNINDCLNDIGETTYQILKELEKSRKILQLPSRGSEKLRISDDYQIISTNLSRISNIAQQKGNDGIVLFQGAAVGGLAAVGSWTLVSMLGTASTGTAIATLSGAAAHNAILAWFGGGALAAGGGGMVAGTATLGLIFAAPIVIFSSYKTHSSATKLIEQTKEMNDTTNKVAIENEGLIHALGQVRSQEQSIKQKHRLIKQVNDDVYKLLYPKGKLTQVRRNLSNILSQDYYTKEEAQAVDRLISTIYGTEDIFSRKPSSKKMIN